jgi:predicted secreted protein
VDLSIGKILVVQIPTIPQEGFDWVLVDHDASMLVLEGEGTYIEDTSEDSAGGMVEFRFNVVGPGESNLTFDYRNEAQGMSSNSFGLTVNVEGSSQNRVVITPDPSGPQMATLKVGDVLVVELPTIPDEGFDWVVPYLDTAILKQIGEAEYTPDSAEGSAGGVTRLQFEAVGAGETSLAVEFAKMSEDTSDMITSNSFGMTVVVE